MNLAKSTKNISKISKSKHPFNFEILDKADEVESTIISAKPTKLLHPAEEIFFRLLKQSLQHLHFLDTYLNPQWKRSSSDFLGNLHSTSTFSIHI